MKYICVASSGRMHYLSQFLLSLSTQTTLKGWELLLKFEPPCPNFSPKITRFIPTTYWSNDHNLGATDNTFTICECAMSRLECEALVYFDDDIILSPDTISLCDWYLHQIDVWRTQDQPNRERHAGLCLCNEASDPSRPDSISPNDTWRGLVGQGYCYNRAQWLDFVKPNFYADNPTWAGHSYDWALAVRAQELGKIILRPRYSRSQHIGVVGLHGAAAGVHLEPFPKDFAQVPSKQFILEDQ